MTITLHNRTFIRKNTNSNVAYATTSTSHEWKVAQKRKKISRILYQVSITSKRFLVKRKYKVHTSTQSYFATITIMKMNLNFSYRTNKTKNEKQKSSTIAFDNINISNMSTRKIINSIKELKFTSLKKKKQRREYRLNSHSIEQKKIDKEENYSFVSINKTSLENITINNKIRNNNHIH